MAREKLQMLRASEVGEYMYRARAWWLRRVVGLEPEGRERRERGSALHRRHGRTVAASRALLWLGLLLVLVAVGMIVFIR